MTRTTTPAPPPGAPAADRDVAGLVDDLTALLGPDLVLADDRSLDKASVDGSYLSPILRAQWPIGRPEVVCRPTTVEQVPAVVRAAVRRRVPITSRGKGTGNYGQVVPLHGGLVLDLTALRNLTHVNVGGRLVAEGARSLHPLADEADAQLTARMIRSAGVRGFAPAFARASEQGLVRS